ncbi:MAG: carboxylating nicotinate-nucleotide diphosphorylase [Actinobacteria bacterium]|nr:carboxylating nicotinate-nucleotide diphosphorylase [Actinomycetota bacterium]
MGSPHHGAVRRWRDEVFIVTPRHEQPFYPLSPQIDSHLHDVGLSPTYVEALIRSAILEDLDDGYDVTTHSTVPGDHRSEVVFTARKPGCVAGVPVVAAVLEVVCGTTNLLYEPLVQDGDVVLRDAALLRAEASTRDLLTSERTALNLFCHLSGIATTTREWADQLSRTGAVVRDTRKTTPGLRKLEKYAVRCGGGQNHRMSLSDAALVKDNHIAAAGGVAAAFRAVREHAPNITVEIEVDTLDQLREALSAGADLVLLDNMPPNVLREAVAISRQHSAATGRKVILEASGGLTLANAGAVGATGVDYISVGGLTHSSSILDIGLDYVRTL